MNWRVNARDNQITILKTVVAFISGSTSMFAESIHSFADTLNQSLLLIGIRRSAKPADAERGYGYGIERFFWSLISACGILFIGAGVTVYHSIESLIHTPVFNENAFRFSAVVLLGGRDLDAAQGRVPGHRAGAGVCGRRDGAVPVCRNDVGY